MCHVLMPSAHVYGTVWTMLCLMYCTSIMNYYIIAGYNQLYQTASICSQPVWVAHVLISWIDAFMQPLRLMATLSKSGCQ